MKPKVLLGSFRAQLFYFVLFDVLLILLLLLLPIVYDSALAQDPVYQWLEQANPDTLTLQDLPDDLAAGYSRLAIKALFLFVLSVAVVYAAIAATQAAGWYLNKNIQFKRTFIKQLQYNALYFLIGWVPFFVIGFVIASIATTAGAGPIAIVMYIVFFLFALLFFHIMFSVSEATSRRTQFLKSIQESLLTLRKNALWYIIGYFVPATIMLFLHNVVFDPSVLQFTALGLFLIYFAWMRSLIMSARHHIHH